MTKTDWVILLVLIVLGMVVFQMGMFVGVLL